MLGLDRNAARYTWTAVFVLVLVAGGSIAGIAGCFLSVPVLAALRIVYRQFLFKAPPVVAVPDGAATQ